MRIGTKILLLMLLITVGSSAVVIWIVTLNLTSYETDRANEQISLAIEGYRQHLEDHYQQTNRIVRAMLEAPAPRSLLQAADDPSDASAREQLKQEVLGRDVQAELDVRDGSPAFHVLVNGAGEVLVTASGANPSLGEAIAARPIRWPVDAVLARGAGPAMQYIATPVGLFLAMGVPLRTQLSEAPTHAYFVGFRIDDRWVQRQLTANRTRTAATGAPLAGWFVMDGKVVAGASSDPGDPRVARFTPETTWQPSARRERTTAAGVEPIEFHLAGEHFLGQAFDFHPADAKAGRLILASSLDEALVPLHRLQRNIILIGALACLIVAAACRGIAVMISRPINDLVAGTRRVSAGQFDEPVKSTRRDELRHLADSFNEMAAGLKERDVLREERVKIERDLAVARKIQMDVLPKELPPCPGYDMAAFSLPAAQTGGDIYDLVAVALDPPEANRPASLVLLLADATGHGIGPALSVTQVRSMLRIGVRLRAELEDVLSQINRQLCQDLGPERFVTAFLGMLDLSSHHVNYQSAGQGPLLHFHAATGAFEWLDSSAMPLGIFEESMSNCSRTLRLEPGDLLVLLTDGFYEYNSASGDMMGQERIAEVIKHHHRRSTRDLLNEILTATYAFAQGAPQLDDMTALLIKRDEET